MGAAAIVDVDGTLVDSNYQHAIAWYRAFREQDLTPPIWLVHRHMGMGGDQLVAAVAGPEVEQRAGDAIREAESRHYGELIGEVRPLEGARELLEALAGRGHPVVLASSAKREETEHYIELIGAGDLIDAYTSAADVERTKPAPDLVTVAMLKVRELSAVMVGDSTWDVRAAERAEVNTVALLTGGFSEGELRGAGAVDVFGSLIELRDRLETTPLR